MPSCCARRRCTARARTASEPADDIFGDAARTVTVRAEISRMRHHLAEVPAHRPYRFREGVEVAVIHPEHPGDLLPRSTAPVVVGARRRSDRRTGVPQSVPRNRLWPELHGMIP
jgi:hypothetical protein